MTKSRPWPAFKVTSRENAMDACFTLKDVHAERPVFEAQHIVSVGCPLEFAGQVAQLCPDGKFMFVPEPTLVKDRQEEFALTAGVGRAMVNVRRLWDAGQDVWFHCRYGQQRSFTTAFVILAAYMGADKIEMAFDEVYKDEHHTSPHPRISEPALVNLVRYSPLRSDVRDSLREFTTQKFPNTRGLNF